MFEVMAWYHQEKVKIIVIFEQESSAFHLERFIAPYLQKKVKVALSVSWAKLIILKTHKYGTSHSQKKPNNRCSCLLEAVPFCKNKLDQRMFISTFNIANM